ncbi:MULTISPECIES: PPK2 family polyphosphate kinase [Leeuwenhoekiella]|jgi:PPK2 family polyphosphate:nucleotide phosphotransferase|uniref:PPK2 family polyphosphate kinase n=1 Tax=Leeuwenhoekiella TaxID=283735 RepID=UPI000C5E3C44|nr:MULTISPECIES: PPK2 family polyphosphate kinase [Leeuwenhoekiella]MAO44687.1 phosphate--nucleotide phosphotransferase [Leeuwenhoekiella sp.]HBT08764.1 phosphate--nucleotide phosphotransferase [Leeuwenhoekiella sp.]|tara:strand:+ start:6523 stop:7389 length:867 start_codon:yes stop_codon:yes gene_type:complete
MKASDYQITGPVKLSERKTHEDFGKTKELEQELDEVSKKIADIQNAMYAHGKYAALICIQGMDTAGKDSLIREVFKNFNARGVVVHSFKTPTSLELGHDYLWRHYIALPARGKVGVFNRTHYENVLVTRVHPEYILNENIPGINEVSDIDEAFWENRFEQINNFEKHIADNGTIIFKFFLHLSKEEQKNRLLRRLNKPNKNWKFSAGDLKERALWDEYQQCYEDAINKTSKFHAPWYVIPADDKPTARLILANILLEKLSSYKDIKEPELDEKTKNNIDAYRKQLESE